MANTYVNKIQLADGTQLIDLTDATATADKILSGYSAYSANGEKLNGNATAVISSVHDGNGNVELFGLISATDSQGNVTLTPAANVSNANITDY